MKYSDSFRWLTAISAVMMLLLVLSAMAYPVRLARPVAVTPCHQSQPSPSQSSSSCYQYEAKYLSLLKTSELFSDDDLSLMGLGTALVLISLIWADLLFKPPRG